jgi:hypothetical protein
MADGKSDTHCGTIVEADQEAVAACASQINTGRKAFDADQRIYNLCPNSGDSVNRKIQRAYNKTSTGTSLD